jgi:hypothetical protein
VEGDAGHAQSSCLGEDSLGGNIPLVVPSVIVAGGDAIDGGHDFAKLAGTLAAGAPKARLVSYQNWTLSEKNGYSDWSGIEIAP